MDSLVQQPHTQSTSEKVESALFPSPFLAARQSGLSHSGLLSDRGFDLSDFLDASPVGAVDDAPESTRPAARGSVKGHDEVSGELERIGLRHLRGRGFFGSGG
jgi:hypothetical protein